MDGCESCIKTVRTEKGTISVDMCKMLGTCTCNEKNKKNIMENIA